MIQVSNSAFWALTRLLSSLLSILAVGINSVHAANVTVNVTIVAPPACVINDNNTIEVNFGKVLTTRVNGGSEYLRPVNYTLDCQNMPSDAMKLMVQGAATPFNNHALQTNFDELGIELHANGGAQPINEWINFTYPNKPILEVVPVKRDGSTLPTGLFTAGATLMVDYQ